MVAGMRLLLFLLIFAFLIGCAPPVDETGPRKITYWEKWSGFEGEACGKMVESFNAKEQARAKTEPGYRPIEVTRVSVSKIEQKLLVAIAGGNPPDVAGLYSWIVTAYADKGALTDLTDELAEAGISRDDYTPVFWNMCEHRNRMWGIPTTPATTALHWNKRLFREVGLDPDRPPETIEELNEMAEKLTLWEVTLPDGSKEQRSGYARDVPQDQKRLLRIGFLPAEPGWWAWGWGFFYGGKLLSEDGNTVTATDPANVRALEWVADFTRGLGKENVMRFRTGFGNFSSPQNPFMAGKVAMIIQGVWMYNFIDKYAPGLEWGVGPFPHPADRPDLVAPTPVETDILTIPTDCPNPEEAMEFLKFVYSTEGIEILCMGHRKFSPRSEESEAFKRDHPHPHIGLFRELASSPGAFAAPMTGIFGEYRRDMGTTVDVVQNLNKHADAALADLQIALQRSLEREREMMQRRYGEKE
jgi:multiple sugar transport system substrate-binding protein